MLASIPLVYYALSGLFNFFSSLILSIFVISKNTKSRSNQIFFIFAFGASCWGLFHFLWLSTVKNLFLANFYLRTVMIFVILVPAVFTHFILNLLQDEKVAKINTVNYSICLLTGLTAYTNLFAREPSPFLVFPFWLKPGPVFHIHLAHFLANIIYSHCVMFNAMKNSRGTKRQQIFYVFIGTAIGYTAGILNYLPWYRVPIPPFLNPLVSIYVATVAYAIIRHRLMDIEVVIRRTVVFTGLLAFVYVVYGTAAFLIRNVGHLKNDFWTYAVSLPLIVLGYDRIRNLLLDLTDNYLFQKKKDIKITLNRLAQTIIAILDIDKVGQTILSTLEETLRIESGVILIKDENEANYKILDSFGVEVNQTNFPKENSLIQFLLRQRKLLNLEDPNMLTSLTVEVKEELRALKTNECLPLFLFDDLIGAIILGKKKSDQEFTKEEIDYFPTIASQTATALSNARLFDIQKKNQIEMAQQAKMAAIGTLSAGISHEVKNPLNNIVGLVDMFLINYGKGVYAQTSKEDLTQLIVQIMQMVKDNVSRANGVIERLSIFVKKPKEIKIEKVRLEEAIEGAITMIANELDQQSIKLEKNFAPNLPFVMADLHALEEVFLNLLVNARHAIKEKGQIIISTAKHIHEVEVSVKDTGSGISKENLGKIFDPFFTTKDTTRNANPQAIKGTGLGLHLVREIVKRYGGRITVESTVGVGTTFHVFLPIPKEKIENV